MADTQTANGAGGSRRRRGRALLVVGVVAFVLFDFWLIADHEIVAGDSYHDDAWFLQKGKCGYWFDEGYSQMSFIKEPVYPLFVWVSYTLGIPLRLTTEAAYLAAAGFLAWCLVIRQTNAAIGLLVFAACALHPMRFYTFQRPLHSTLYPSLLMLAVGALLLQFKLRDAPGRWWRRLLTGVALGLLWNVRPERPLVLLIIVFFLAAAAFRDWRRPNVGAGLRAWIAEWSLPLAIPAAMTLAIMSANYARWGTFAVTDMEAPGFTAAYRALQCIRPQHPIPYVPVTKEVRELAYAVSPTFRELAPLLDKPDGASWAGGEGLYDVPPDEFAAGWFMWALRDATAAAGHCTSARDSEDFYRRIADEINAAAAAGRLPTRWVPLSFLDPRFDNYSGKLIPSWRAIWYVCWMPGYGATAGDAPELLSETRALFDHVACRRAISPEQPTPQAQVRVWIGEVYGHYMELALAAAGLVAGAVLLLPRVEPRWGAYLLPGVAFGIAGFSRLALFTLIDASSFPGRGPDYLYPAALALTIMAVWLLAEGLRLLGGAGWRTCSRGCGLLWNKMVTRGSPVIGSHRANEHPAPATKLPAPSQ